MLSGNDFPEDRAWGASYWERIPFASFPKKARGTYLALVWHVPLQLSTVIAEKENPVAVLAFT